MDKRAQLAEALHQLAHWSTKTANLLDAIDYQREEPITMGTPPCSISVLPQYHGDWPYISAKVPPLVEYDLDGECLLVMRGASCEPSINFIGRVEVSTDHYTALPYETVHIGETDTRYDNCVFHESLEFCADPLEQLRAVRPLLKKDGRIYIRFRPWTAPNGGFQQEYGRSHLAHVHLACDLGPCPVVRVTRPNATYESIMSRLGMKVIHRQVHSWPVEPFVRNPEIWDVIKKRTWTNITDAEAASIMRTVAVDYVLQA